MYYWVEFHNRSSGTIQADSKKDCQTKAMDFGNFYECNLLPYPASPILSKEIDCPPFCYSPEECKGRGCCPKSYACSE